MVGKPIPSTRACLRTKSTIPGTAERSSRSSPSARRVPLVRTALGTRHRRRRCPDVTSLGRGRGGPMPWSRRPRGFRQRRTGDNQPPNGASGLRQRILSHLQCGRQELRAEYDLSRISQLPLLYVVPGTERSELSMNEGSEYQPLGVVVRTVDSPVQGRVQPGSRRSARERPLKCGSGSSPLLRI